MIAGFVVVVWGAFQRIGTTANVETIEFTRNLAGGFVAVGFADRAPGFVLLSALERDDVTLSARRVSSVVGGDRSTVSVRTEAESFIKRLRGPIVVTVGDKGRVMFDPVAWSFSDFQRIREATDCVHGSEKQVRRCGAPFADLRDMLKGWPSARIPPLVRRFLERHARPSDRLLPGTTEYKDADTSAAP